MQSKFATSRKTAQHFGISISTLKAMRLGHLDRPPTLTEGVHWTRLADRNILFNLALIEDFLMNKNNPEAHQRAIDSYLASLPSSQP